MDFQDIKTWFQGEISKCKNKMDFQILKHGFNVKFQNAKIKWIFP
jgi:hypothetical protein